MINVIETTLVKNFYYSIMSYLMLMMVNRQIHYHVIPRYESNISFVIQNRVMDHGEAFQANGWSVKILPHSKFAS